MQGFFTPGLDFKSSTAEATRSPAQPNRVGLRFPGRKIDYTSDCVRPIERGTRAVQDIDTAQRTQRQGKIKVEVRCLGAIHAQAVEQHQRLFKRSSPHGDIRQHPCWSALLDVN